MKLATLDNRIIIRKAGKLLSADWTAVMGSFQQIHDAASRSLRPRAGAAAEAGDYLKAAAARPPAVGS